MSLNNTFQRAADTIFKVFKSLVHTVGYVVITDDGFDKSEVEYLVDMIIDSFAERDVQFLSFSNLIQPTDVKGLIRGEQLRTLGVTELSTHDLIRVVSSDRKYAIIAYNTDPANAVYTLLLRDV